MLRFLYRCVLRAHPAHFRHRFADEMLSIFDQAQGKHAELVFDGGVSLLRQWIFRSHFREASLAQAASDGAPLFFTFGSPRPRTGALVYGALLSILVLNGVCWTMGYAWNHPRFVWIQQPVIRPPASWHKTPSGTQGPSTVGEEPLYSDEGRVLLVFKSSVHAGTQSRPSVPGTASPNSVSEGPAADSHSAPSALAAADLNPGVLQSYVGTYIGDSAEISRAEVTVAGGQLQLEVAGQFKSPLVPVSQTQFVAASVPDCRVEFVKSGAGIVDRLEIYKSGHRITALHR
jgi:hypothetical protein